MRGEGRDADKGKIMQGLFATMRIWAFVIKFLLHSHWEDSENDNKSDLICAFQRSLRLLYGERPGHHKMGEEGQVELRRSSRNEQLW